MSRSPAATLSDDRALPSVFAAFEGEFRTGLLIRRVEEALLGLYATGSLHGTIHTCVGQELLPAMLARYWTPRDYVISNHRGHGHFLAKTGDVKGLIAELLGKRSGASGGYGGSQHLAAERFYSNGIQGGMSPVAVGIADSVRGEPDMVFLFVGDGTFGEGALYEALNLASVWREPLLVIVEDNGYAQSTSKRQTLGGTIDGRAKAFGLPYFEGSVLDLPDLDQACRSAVESVRQRRQPAVLHVATQRLNSHSKGDDNRDPKEVERMRADDLIHRAIAAKLLTAADVERVDAEIRQIIEDLRKEPGLTSVEVFEPVTTRELSFEPLGQRSGRRVVDEINAGLRDLLEADPDMLVIGEDIEESNDFTSGSYGGAFKVTRSLSTSFPGRVRNTPISESAIVGFATGRALAGKATIAEIMFGDFCTLIADQVIQHVSKFPTMYGRSVPVPVMIRTPMGGRRGYGPTHSQSLERLLSGLQNVLLLAPNHRVDVRALYSGTFRLRRAPVLMAEHKLLYALEVSASPVPGYHVESDNAAWPVVRLRPRDARPQCTIATFGYGLHLVEQALQVLLDEDEIFCEVVCPTALSPLNAWPVVDSVRRTRRLLTVEEGATYGGFGAEVVASVAAQARLDGVRRLGNNTVLPCSLPAEMSLLPGVGDIVAACRELAAS